MASRIKNFFLGRGKDKFNVQRATEEAGIRFITKLGLLGERLNEADIENMTDDEVISFANRLFRSAIPWLRVKDDPFMFRKVDAFLDICEMYMMDQAVVNEHPDDIELARAFEKHTKRVSSDARIMLSMSFGAEDVDPANIYVISKPEVQLSQRGVKTEVSSEGMKMIADEIKTLNRKFEDLERGR